MKRPRFSRLFADRLGLRLVLASLLISTLLSTVAAGVQLSYSYKRQRHDTSAVFDQIEKALATPLEKALWKYDFEQVEVILDGIFANDAVATLTLTAPSGDHWTRGADAPFDLQQSYSLFHLAPTGGRVVVGELIASLSLDHVHHRIWAQFWTLLASNLIKAYLSATMLLLLFYILVTKPLKEIARYIDDPRAPGNREDLRLNRAPTTVPDDLDRIVTAQNHARHRLARTISDLQSEVVTRKAAEAEARKAFEVRKTFLANMSHEVRTPLNAIMGLFQLIQMANVPQRQKRQAEVGLNASHHLLAQLVNVLEIARMEADALEIAPHPTQVRQLADQWLETARATRHRQGKRIRLTLRMGRQVPDSLDIDARRVTQIVNNLTDNALKFTPEGHVLIRVDVAQPGCKGAARRLEISVSDTGCGIPASQAEAVFERFNQLDGAETRENGGSGLGLAISRELAVLMGATLTVESPSRYGCYATTLTLSLEMVGDLGVRYAGCEEDIACRG